MVHPFEAPTSLPGGTGVYVYRTAIIAPFISFLFVVLRFYTRLRLLRRQPMVDDYLVALTMVLSIAHAVLTAIATYHGMGLHVWQFSPEMNADYYLWVAITSEFYTAALAGFKSALIFLYLQTFGMVSRRFRVTCYIVLFYTLGYLTANILVEFLGCWPIPKFWRPEIPGYCIDHTAANVFFGIGHVTSDLIIAALPLGPIWNLEFSSTKQKIGLSLTLSSGFIAWAVATIRYVISTYDQFTYDRTWWAGIGFAFSILEVNTGLICTCVPTFSPLLSYLNTTRIANFITGWDDDDDDHLEKSGFDEMDVRDTHDCVAAGDMKRYSVSDDVVIPVIYNEMARFSPIDPER
ncbi:hypothetical protein GGR50DRAFT_635700 [Xylaria sp. CBS 124048]|nr:hypothetical protein GGR50DRAFT_635700 [Xylaria sp. CBS 124048]